MSVASVIVKIGYTLPHERVTREILATHSTKAYCLLRPCVHCGLAKTLPTSLAQAPGHQGGAHLGHQGQENGIHSVVF